ncbi:ABC transporter substrate-binding protein [Desulfobacterales bacterium HSG16]|nr:ABC transporter substrate-binding protein [Desulfobacterales bacterium HSG16]
MKKAIVIAIISILLTAGSAYARQYKIANVAWTGCAPANVAEIKGFWKEQGIDVKVFTTVTPNESHELLKNRLVDIKFDMIGSSIGQYMDGEPIRIIAETNWSQGGDKILVKKNLDPAALKGKPVGVYFNVPAVTFFLNQYLSTINVKLSDTRIIEMEADALADHFIAGRFGIIVSYDPTALRAERKGNGKIVATSATYEGCIPEGMMVMKDVLGKIPEEDLIKILKGWIKAVKWTQDPANWKEYMKILNERTFKGMDPYSEKDLKEMVGAVHIHSASEQLERNREEGGLHIYLEQLKEFLSANKMLKKEFTHDTIFFNKAIVKALSQP